DLSELLQKHKVDMIMTRPPYPNNTVVVPILEETLSIYAPMVALENMFKERAQEVACQLSRSADIELLKDCPFILPRSGSVRDACNELFVAHQISPRVATETDFLETAITFCRAGMGVTLSPIGMLQDLTLKSPKEKGASEIYPITEKDTSRTLAICYLDRAVVSRSMQQFISVAKGKLSERIF
ncbi:MAG TPA: LysR family transcriptional regulator substrate-binding protein, partial [Clostridia bacterium]|nr:LysR family transcriptional regulator substrate-binding protein [Clostridia bacterium]